MEGSFWERSLASHLLLSIVVVHHVLYLSGKEVCSCHQYTSLTSSAQLDFSSTAVLQD
jgi:hypothetical protein